MSTDFPKSFLDSVLISTFLEVKAPDRHYKDAFLHDDEDNPIDCNIYHPKYGFYGNKSERWEGWRGFVTHEKGNIMSSCTLIYDDPRTRQKVYCYHSYPVLCLHDNGSLTNKDGETVKNVDYNQTNLTRSAIDKNDFAEIYAREFIRSELIDTPINHKTLKETLIIHVNHLIKLHQDDRAYGRTLSLPIIAKAQEFLNWLNEDEMPTTFDDKKIFTLEYLLALHKEFNTTLFNNSFDEIRQALNDPENISHKINFVAKKVRIYPFLYHLELKCKYPKFGTAMCKKQNLEYDKYTSKRTAVTSQPDLDFKKKLDDFDSKRIK